MFELEKLNGEATEKYIKDLALFRIDNFRKYPYLYDGNMVYEKKYLQSFSKNNNSLIYVAKINNEIVGISTAVPLESEYEIVKGTGRKFTEVGLDVKDFYYFGEIIIRTEYRGKGIAAYIFKIQEEDAKKKGYKGSCFLVVDRKKDHPLKPKDYIEPDGMWSHMGYRKTDISMDFEWPTIQVDSVSKVMKNTMVYWIKTF